MSGSDLSSVTIVPATREDLPTVAAVAERIWRRHYPGIITHEQIDYMLGLGYSLERLAEQITSPGRWLDLARVDGGIVGLANPYLTGAPGEMKLDKLYVLQEFHGRGIGSRLIAHVADRARTLGCTRLVLNVNKRNASSIRAYERNGFRVRESVVVDIGRGFVMDDHIMEKAL
jgi:GNAT superfamily N-acetyltransferase